ncbi:MAG: pyridoxal phosphate-dependent aminotransferase [Gammaproteobacteria bacterium]|nr:pyridoxal phosphate-dependent aminotransferase [Gammaproteobacteria bacterium]
MAVRIQPARRMTDIQAPIMPIIADLIAANPDTITLGQGVVSYGPPPAAIAHTKRFGETLNEHRYQAVAGIPELIEQIDLKLANENSIGRDGREVVVTAGANMAFLSAILAIADPGDEIILLRPFYFNHEMAIRMIGCIPVLVDTDENYQPVLGAIEEAITSRTRAVVTVSPNNPTGATYSKQSLIDINSLCGSRGIFHISDEAYEYFVYDDASHFSAASLPGSEGHTISLYSLSKAYGFASWRIGFMAIPTLLRDSVIKVQDTNLICAPVVSQQAAVAALRVGRSYCDEQVHVLSEVRRLALGLLGELDDVVTIPPAKGAFYFFLRINRDVDAMDVARYLIEKHKVAVVPGDTFGTVGGSYLRVSYGALDKGTVSAGIARLVEGLSEMPNSLARS